MAREDAVRLGLPPGHRREDAADRPHVRTGAHEHDHHRMHDDLLQVSRAKRGLGRLLPRRVLDSRVSTTLRGV